MRWYWQVGGDWVMRVMPPGVGFMPLYLGPPKSFLTPSTMWGHSERRRLSVNQEEAAHQAQNLLVHFLGLPNHSNYEQFLLFISCPVSGVCYRCLNGLMSRKTSNRIRVTGGGVRWKPRQVAKVYLEWPNSRFPSLIPSQDRRGLPLGETGLGKV